MSQDSLDKIEKSIVQSINSLKDEIINLKDIVIKDLQDENAWLKEKCEKLENRVAILESNHNDLAQYGRRNNVVFSGIPENVPDNNLESTVISVLPDIDVQVEPRNIEASCRIGKPTSKAQKTIVRFVNRKNCEKILANKKKLLKLNNEKHNFHVGTNIFVNENLTPMNDTIAYNCRKLNRIDLIQACYTRNGIIYIKENETSRLIKVFHLVKLFSLFPDHFRNNDEIDQYHDVSIDANS